MDKRVLINRLQGSEMNSDPYESAASSRRNPIRKFLAKASIKDPFISSTLAELYGTFILVLIGDGVMGGVILGCGNTVSAALGWGFALLVAVTVCGGVSGGHVNPAITLAMACIGRFPWKRVVPYILAQYIGAFFAAAIVYGIYANPIDAVGGANTGDADNTGDANNTGGANTTAAGMPIPVLATYPNGNMTNAEAFGDNLIGAAILMTGYAATTDRANLGISPGLYPLMFGFSASASYFAYPLCGGPMNPARDFSPRLVSSFITKQWGDAVWKTRDYYFWIPVIATHVGAVLGGLFYYLLIEIHAVAKHEQEKESEE